MTPFLSAVLWNTSIASLLAVLVGCLGRASWFQRRPAAMHVLWMLVLAKFVTPAILPVPILPARINAAAHSTKSDATNEAALAVLDAGGTAETAETVLPKSIPQPQAMSGSDRWATLLISFSCFVSALLVVRTSLHGVRFHGWLKSVSQPDARLDRLLQRGRTQMGLSRSPDVQSLAALCAPFLWAGGRRACIFVPQTVIETLDDEQLTGVLCHELVHHARRDAWSSLFASTVAAACWWNPLVWWARRQLRLTQELCCDAQVLQRSGRSRRAYAETLLTTLELVTSGVQLPSALASSWDDCESLKRRFQMIGEAAVITRLSAGFVVSTVLLAGGLLCLPVQAQVDSTSKPQAVDAQPPSGKNAEAHASGMETAPLFKREEPLAAPAVAVEPAMRIVGRITDPAGKPLAGQQIVAAVLPPPPKRAPKPGRRMEWKLAGEVPPSATSDEEGRFTIDKADARATIMLQFYGAELQQPRQWKPKGSLATTISLKVAEKESELEVGYVPHNMTSKESTVDGRVTREVAITWSPTRIIVQWGYAPTIEKWKESRTLAEVRDPRWKDGLLATDETVWVVPPGRYMYDEHNQHLDLGSALQLGTSWGQGLRADSEREIILFFGALGPSHEGARKTVVIIGAMRAALRLPRLTPLVRHTDAHVPRCDRSAADCRTRNCLMVLPDVSEASGIVERHSHLAPCERSNSIRSRCPPFVAHARGVAHGSASGSTGSAPRSRYSLTSSMRPQRQAQPSGVDFSN